MTSWTEREKHKHRIRRDFDVLAARKCGKHRDGTLTRREAAASLYREENSGPVDNSTELLERVRKEKELKPPVHTTWMFGAKAAEELGVDLEKLTDEPKPIADVLKRKKETE